MGLKAPPLLAGVPMIGDDLGGHHQSKGTLLARGLIGPGVKPEMSPLSILWQGRRDPSLRMGFGLLLCWAAREESQTADLVVGSPFLLGIWDWNRPAFDTVSDVKEVLLVGLGPDANPQL